MKRVSLIGFGAIGAAIAGEWSELARAGVDIESVCVRPAQVTAARQALPSGIAILTDVSAMLASRPDAVIEAAGQSALRLHGVSVLEAGADLVALSVGALSDPLLRSELSDASARSGRQVVIPAGAMAGFDGLLALAKSGLEAVRYTSIKPCLAWRDTPAEDAFDLALITKRTTIFSGTAADAASLYPKNANLAAAIALAGIGFEATRVELVANPHAADNCGTLEARSATSSLFVEVQGEAESRNPKTSAIVAASVISALSNQSAAIRFI